jgi:ribulose bisphosphate carboxylase small subunit
MSGSFYLLAIELAPNTLINAAFGSIPGKAAHRSNRTQEEQVLRELENCLAEHAGDYVRLIGIDPKAKRRVMEKIIQRPGDRPAQFTNTGSSYASPSSNYSN